MGKKAKFKKLRRFASQMPVINYNVVKGERVKGSELEVKEVEGKPVVADDTYRKKSLVQQSLNHYRKMKEAYNRFGFAGANAYAIGVANFVKKQTEKQETDCPTIEPVTAECHST